MLQVTSLPPVAQQLETNAYAFGREAQQRGMQEVPAQDANLWPLMKGLVVGQGLPLMQAWLKGYRDQQDEQQIREFACQLKRETEVEQLLQSGLKDAARKALWWQLFDQLPDAH
ncbi:MULTISPECIES: hypothetical protein [Hymenobacter]|uniref:Uncharacterized protein n=1 Tax=Hymenobacter guriensis TaxID=2793065 RepID=A0ABS0L4A8_9BACT|nr:MULTISPECIES: hypothetical protein [Hymenobacter]MBG8554980.1 hypothetical protein [Hymenobacter guriensis]MCR5890427.1 hypothetical protein [Hymenobacter sp. J193]